MTELRVSINDRTLDTLNVPDELLFVETWQDLVAKVDPEFYQGGSEDLNEYTYQDIQKIIDSGGNRDGSVTATDFSIILKEQKLNSIEYQSFIRILSVSRFFSDTGIEQSFIKKFIRQGYPITAIRYATDAAKDDLDLALFAVANNAWSLQFFSDRIRSQPLVGLRALEISRDAWSRFALGRALDEQSLRETCLVGWDDSMNVDGVTPPKFEISNGEAECRAPTFDFDENNPTLDQAFAAQQYVSNMQGVNPKRYGSDFVEAVQIAESVSSEYLEQLNNHFIEGNERKVLGSLSKDDLSKIPAKWLDIYLQRQSTMLEDMGAGGYSIFIQGQLSHGQRYITKAHMERYAGIGEDSGLFAESCARNYIGVSSDAFLQTWREFTDSSYYNEYELTLGQDQYHMEVFANSLSPFVSIKVTKNGMYSHVIDSDICNPEFIDQKPEALSSLIDLSLTLSALNGNSDHQNFTSEELNALLRILQERSVSTEMSGVLQSAFEQTIAWD